MGESFGNVYIEALSSGIPVVAHDEEITRWILGDHAVLVDTTSEEALSDAINGAIRSPGSHLQEAAAWAHGRYNWSIIARQYIDFLSEVVKDDRRQT
jgi:glycosyltransferase involved in cell wall biosynthesis